MKLPQLRSIYVNMLDEMYKAGQLKLASKRAPRVCDAQSCESRALVGPLKEAKQLRVIYIEPMVDIEHVVGIKPMNRAFVYIPCAAPFPAAKYVEQALEQWLDYVHSTVILDPRDAEWLMRWMLSRLASPPRWDVACKK